MTASATTSVQRGEFTNEPFIDFSKAENRAAMQDALAYVRGQFGREYPLTIGGEKVFTTEKLQSTNPSKPSEVIGDISEGHCGDGQSGGRGGGQGFPALEARAGRGARGVPVSHRGDSAQAAI